MLVIVVHMPSECDLREIAVDKYIHCVFPRCRPCDTSHWLFAKHMSRRISALSDPADPALDMPDVSTPDAAAVR